MKKPTGPLAPALKNVFGDDDEDDDESKAPLPELIDAEQASAIDKLAEYVATNGAQFEESESHTDTSEDSVTEPCTRTSCSDTSEEPL
jgi:hypothetical protein